MISIFVQLFIPISIIILFTFIFPTDERKRKILNSKMLKDNNYKYNNEFENIYSQLNNSDLSRAKKENKNNIFKYAFSIALFILAIIYIILISIPHFRQNSITKVNIFLFSIPAMILGTLATVLIIKKEDIEYKKDVIKKLISFINPKIEYHATKKKEEISKIYTKSDFRDYASYSYITDHMYYEINDYAKVTLEDIGLYKAKHSAKPVFEGIVVNIQKTKNKSTGFLVAQKQLLKDVNWVKDDSEKISKYFDLYSLIDIPFSIDENVKEKIVYLYEKYHIMFEISAKQNNIYIRFFTGKMFEPNAFGLLNKKKLYRDYIMFTNILSIIEELNSIL